MKVRRQGNYRWVIAGIAIFLVVMALLAAFCGWLWNSRSAGKPLEAFGYEWMVSQSDGMEPALSKGSLLLLGDPAEPQAGDVIVAGRENGTGGTVCRVLEVRDSGLLVKEDRAGDSMELPAGEPVSPVAYSLPLLGYVIQFLLTTRGLVIAIAAPCLLFFLIELALLIRVSKRKNPLLGQEGDLRGKLELMTEGDEDENFVDVTAEYTAGAGRRKYRSPLREEMEEPADKFADLDFNPLIREQPADTGLESVEIPAGTPEWMKILIGSTEAASIPLEKNGAFCVKNGGWRIDIIVARDEGAGK